ncbi:MAG: hypothetical protein JWN70_5123 [Planctomycetaceae bacterium]|nr:hypothetical protein [Planctomycetaceae bacterium]
MIIEVSEDVKRNLARFGPNKLFGDDVDERKKLTDEQEIALFDRVWKAKLEAAIQSAERCDSDEAKQRLTFSQQQYFRASQEHRSFRMQQLNAEFVVQLLPSEGNNFKDTYELTQLWRVSSSDTHPKTLFVTFDTVEQREQFKHLAGRLGIKDVDLGLHLVMDFMTKHPGRFLTDRL